MGILVQVCVVVVTVAIVVLAYMATRLMMRLDAMTKTLEVRFQQLQQVLEDVRVTSKRVLQVIDVVDETALSVRRGVLRLEGVVDRAASVGSTVLDGFERPVQQAVSLWKGVEAGASLLKAR